MSYAEARMKAVAKVAERKPVALDLFQDPDHIETMESLYGCFTFNEAAMRKYLPKGVYKQLQLVIEDPQVDLDIDTANAVAHGMKEWALDHGATHFCHWFQPLTGSTAEKHDSFLDLEDDGSPIARFGGAQLIQGEPDASSFPSGGMRATFEARGYTGWDPTSPAFLLEGPAGMTLTIPSVFVSYHGEVLDKKTPLLRATDALDHAVKDLLALFDKEPLRAFPTVGSEQEYFLVDRALTALRPDLQIAKRTVLGAEPAKGQQLEDQYFGSVPPRVIAFMQELDYELYRLGIPAKTRHNEVAPSQFEIAPVFEEANLAADHNQILMASLERVARRHNFVVNLHEKPFAGINGSGKHLNWSMGTSDGENLLDPGTTPQENTQFLVVLSAVLKAVFENQGLLRAAIASSGNDHRLGANEAPPAILSVFLGAQLNKLLDEISEGKALTSEGRDAIQLGVTRLPALAKDATDRNRTSPFAFTGNKFEFRALGSSTSISTPATMLTAAVAGAVSDATRCIQKQMEEGKSLQDAAMETVTKFVKASNGVRFEGDGYSDEWVQEAEKRGLLNLRTTPEALDQYTEEKNIETLAKLGVYKAPELNALYHVELDRYVKQIEIEASLLAEIAGTMVLPAALSFAGELAQATQALAASNIDFGSGSLLKDIGGQIRSLEGGLKALREKLESIGSLEVREQAGALEKLLKSEMDEVRGACDALEGMVADRSWPLPKYREMLFPS